MILIIAGIIIIGLIISFTMYMSWKKRKINSVYREMKLSGKPFIITPEFASFRGATKTYGQTKCDGIIGLTDSEIIFIPLVGKKIEIALNRIKKITEEKTFLGSYRAGLSFLVLHGADMEIGFYVKDNLKWQNTLLGLLK